MKYKTVSNVTLPMIGIGTWSGKWGSRERPKPDSDRDEICKSALRFSIDNGATHVDTAELYGDGYSEELIGQVIKDYPRSKIFITSKVRGDHLDYNSVISACDASLARLGIDFLDLYLVHFPSKNGVPIEETMRAMNDLLESGKIKNIGVSNFSLDKLKEAEAVSKAKIVANQVEYSLLRRNIGREGRAQRVESELLPYCQKRGIFLIAYGPLAKGKLAKKGNVDLVDFFAEKYGCSQGQITLAWLLSKENVVVIPQSTNTEHLQDNINSVNVELSSEDIIVLDSLDETKLQESLI